MNTHFIGLSFPTIRSGLFHVPTSSERNAIELSPVIHYTLADLGIKISTGPVVDFRLKKYLRDSPGPGTVPLLYPAHFNSNGTTWPIDGMKKPNAIERNADTEKCLRTRAASTAWCGTSRLRKKCVKS